MLRGKRQYGIELETELPTSGRHRKLKFVPLCSKEISHWLLHAIYVPLTGESTSCPSSKWMALLPVQLRSGFWLRMCTCSPRHWRQVRKASCCWRLRLLWPLSSRAKSQGTIAAQFYEATQNAKQRIYCDLK